MFQFAGSGKSADNVISPGSPCKPSQIAFDVVTGTDRTIGPSISINGKE